ncbi:enoyl-CoA hydratase [Brevirhabdus pacifica]|uniref:Enoyl-CoA hydratase domain-containing protein 3, mitochondrial n=1 Tax=Brevirhabdus pacifica TaxID=1267768 RepID=A0A1U7DM02_9RHOB|nr:enoyl-CoA hydratase [Brevirhabdus pacifica]APX90898.1 enoyl-CoA hydratase [Brevirhabdus pacifica]OWU80332.1 enoyl-CoA hydratase [Loktanella sp. 22II-4b]PJJ86962.1 enoyl-CoA hydratase/carnithine racemase [Brevirhabdus pacifica]
MHDLVEREDNGAVARLTLNDPGRVNALSDAMLGALARRLDNLAEDPAIRAVVLAARGKAFCGGHDLREMTAARQAPDGGAKAFADLFARCTNVMLQIRDLPQPVIAEVQGVATAAGCQLVATCDMAIAAEDVRFGVNGVNIGLFCSTPMVALSRNVPRKAAFEMLTTGGFIDTARAVELGLVNRAVPAPELTRRTRELAEMVAAKSGPVVRMGKRGFYQQLELPLEEAYALTGRIMVENLGHADAIEGMGAFVEKRAPRWEQDAPE